MILRLSGMYSWSATISLTNNFMEPFDRVLEFIVGCKFSARHFFQQTFTVQNLAENLAYCNFFGGQKFGR